MRNIRRWCGAVLVLAGAALCAPVVGPRLEAEEVAAAPGAAGAPKLAASRRVGGAAADLRAALDAGGGVAYELTIKGPIDAYMAEGFERSLRRAREAGARAIIVSLDTPGGEVAAALRIGDAIFAVRDIPTIAYVRHEAISAGALIAVCCRAIVMPADTLLGDCQPIVMAAAGTGVMKPAGEKIETYLRAYFHDKAVKNGYPVALAEKMVSVDMEAVEIRFVHEDKLLEEVDFANRAVFDLLWSERMRAFISRKEFEGWAERDRAHFEIVGVAVPQGQLLTMNERQARQNRFALPDVVSWEEMLQAFNISRVQAVGTTFWERTLDFLNWISPVVVSLGAILLFIELVTPGFGLVGSLGIFSFAIFFLTKALIGYADYADIVLFFAGLILLVVEVFLLPGFIVFGLVGLLAVAASILLASQRFAVPETAVEWTIFKQNLLEYGLAFVAAVVVMAILARFLPGSPLLRRLALQPPAPRGPDISGGGTLEETEPGLVGLLGRALTDLRPAGKLDLNGRRLDVTADGEYVRAGDTARVMRLEGNRVYVRREAAASLADDEAGPPPI